jgi:hypothetical protein
MTKQQMATKDLAMVAVRVLCESTSTRRELPSRRKGGAWGRAGIAHRCSVPVISGIALRNRAPNEGLASLERGRCRLTI